MTTGKLILATCAGTLLTVAIVGAGAYLWVDINQALNAKHNAERELPEVERQMEELNRTNPVANSPQPIAVMESKPCKASKAVIEAERKAMIHEAKMHAIMRKSSEDMIALLRSNGADTTEMENKEAELDAKEEALQSKLWNNCGPDGKEMK